MARKKSEYLSAFGIAHGIFKSLADAALRSGAEDPDGLLRQLEDHDVADAVVGGLIERAGLPKPTPNLDGLSEVFEVVVGGRTVTCAWIPKNYFERGPSNKEVMDEIARRHLRCPSREVAEAAFDAKQGEMATNPSVAIDGVVQTGAGGGEIVGFVSGSRGGRFSSLSNLHDRWGRNDRFLVVVSE